MSVGRLAAVFLLALALRTAAAYLLDAPGKGVATAHDEHAQIARNLAAGRGFRFDFFGDPARPALTSQQAPLVPGLLAGCYLLAGSETRAAFALMIGVQLLFSAATCVWLTTLARRTLADDRLAMPVGLAAAAYPALVVSGLHVQACVWNLGWLVLMLTSCQRLRREGRGALGMTLAGAGGLLADPILGGPLAALTALLLVERGTRRQALAVAASVALLLVPWTVRNGQVHGRLVLVKDSFGYVFWQGNNRLSVGTDKQPLTEDQRRPITRAADPLAAHRAAVAVRAGCRSVNECLSTADVAYLQDLPDEHARMAAFGRWAWRSLRDDPAAYLRKCLWRLKFWLWFDETNPRSFVAAYRWGYVLLLALAVPALRLDRRTLPLWLAYAALSAVHVLVITSARFRLPVEMLMLIPAAATVRWVASGGRQPAVLAEGSVSGAGTAG